MTSLKPPEGRVADILQYCGYGQEFVRDADFESFLNDAKARAACLHALLIMGEAASFLPLEFRSSHPEIEWRDLVGMRNKLIHGYDDVRWEIVWEVLQRELPLLEAQLKGILADLGQ